MDDKQVEALIVKALGDPKWEYRTVDGIVADTKLEASVVVAFLKCRTDIVWKSSVPDKKGQDLFTLNNRHSQSKEFWRGLSTFMSKLSS